MDLDSLSALESPARSLVTIYLDHPNGSPGAVLSELLKPVKAVAGECEHDRAMSIRNDVERISGLSARLETDPARAWAVFASDLDGIFEVVPLRRPVGGWSMVGRRPYLRPLRLMPPLLRVGLAVVERARVDLFVADDERIDEVARFEADRGKDNFGGFQGYEEHRVIRHAETETARMMRRAAAALFEHHQVRQFDLLAIGGHQPDLETIDPFLHDYLRRLPIERFVVDPGSATPALLHRHVQEAIEAVRRRHTEELAGTVAAAEHAGTPVALGTSHVLEAANARAVERLVVAGSYIEPGAECAGCGLLAGSSLQCPVCGAEMEEVEDVVGSAIEAVVRHGGLAEGVPPDSALEGEGVAALLRFPV